MTEPEAIPAPTPRRATLGRWIAAAGFLGLSVSFFLPQSEWFDPTEKLLSPDEPHYRLLVFPFVYAFAMLVFFLFHRAPHGERAERALAHAACLLTLLAFLTYAGVLAAEFGQAGLKLVLREWVLMGPLVAGAVVGTILTLAIWWRAPVPARVGACVAVAGFSFAGFFMLFVASPAQEARFGGWLSLVASGLVAVGGLLEAFSLWESTP